MVWTITHAAQQLSLVSDTSPEEIERCLRLIGFTDPVHHLDGVLSMAAKLGSRFEYLHSVLPNLGESIEVFLLAGRLSEALTRTDYAKHHAVASSKGRTLGVRLNGLRDNLSLSFVEKSSPGIVWDLITLFWLIEAPACLYPVSVTGVSTKDGFSLEYRELVYFAKSLPDAYGDEFPSFRLGMMESGLWDWLRDLDACWHKKDSDYRPYKSLAEQLPLLGAHATTASVTLPVISSARPASLPLEERYLSCGHWYYPRPAQLEALQALLGNQSDAEPSSEYFFETLVIALGLATCKTVQEVLNLNILGESYAASKIHIEAVVITRQSLERCLVWKVPLRNAAKPQSFPLPERVAKALCNLIKPNTNTKLVELLPPFHGDWSARCLGFLAKKLHCPHRHANFILRDTLLRICYQISGNRAVVSWLVPARLPKERSSQIALTHYLNPYGKRHWLTYQQACQDLFGKGSVPDAWSGELHVDYLTSPSEHKKTVLRMKQDIHAAQQQENLVELHNAFARYSLLLLIVATGHRKSLTPFFFPWDLDLDLRLAFIADKCIVGSEARWVPLAAVAVEQIKAYLLHLKGMTAKKVETKLPAVVHAHIANLLDAGYSRKPDPNCSTGLFFLIRSDGTIEPMTTGHLDRWLKEAGLSIRVGLLRSAIANDLWETLSGWEVTAMLGHANDLHPFGPASTWSVLDWADKVRPLIDKYLDKREWRVVNSPLPRQCLIPTCYRPAMAMGMQSYEGRFREKNLARQRALQAVREGLADDWLANTNLTLEAYEEALKTVRQQIDLRLSGEEADRYKRPQELSELVNSLRGSGPAKAAFFPRDKRVSPSPVELPFGRHLSIASDFRQRWLDRVGESITGKWDWVERVAQLAISLIVLDGLLDPRRVVGTLEAVLCKDGVTAFPDVLVIRAWVETAKYEYEWSTLPGPISSALTLGLREQLAKASDNPWSHSWEKEKGTILERIGSICRKLNGRLEGPRTIDSLCRVFRPWWFVRLPGVLYSIAIGTHNGPAPHALSEVSLFADQEPAPAKLRGEEKSDSTPRAATALDKKRASTALNGMLLRASGSLEEGEANSRHQRLALFKGLGQDMNQELAGWCLSQPIIDDLVGYTESLLKFGGVRDKELRGNSILTYVRSVAPTLINLAWDKDLAEMDTLELQQFYQDVENELKTMRTKWQVSLRLFHRYLRDNHGAPAIPALANDIRIKSRCRSVLVSATAIDQALTMLLNHKLIPVTSREPAWMMLAIGNGYGVRVSECAGLKVGDFDSGDSGNLRIRGNVIRDLKSSAAKRVIPFPLLDARHKSSLMKRRNLAEIAPGSDPYLFETPERNQKIQSIQPLVLWVKSALRSATANDRVVFHDLRRTFATKLVLAGLPLKSEHPALIRARSRLCGNVLKQPSQVYELTRTSPHSPFLIDGIARVLGHANEETLLNVYFHGAPILLADHVEFANAGVTITDRRLGAMLNKVSSGIVKYRHRHATDTLSALVRRYIPRFSKVNLAAPAMGRSRLAKGEEPPVRIASPSEVPWHFFDRLLFERKFWYSSLEVFLKYGDEKLNLAPSAIEPFFQRYREMLDSTGFDDFEPDSSEFLNARPSRSKGVKQGRKAREATLKTIQDVLLRNPDFRQTLSQVVTTWLSNVDARGPWLVCRSTEELDALLGVLRVLGAAEEQIHIVAAGRRGDPLIENLRQRYPDLLVYPDRRFSRGWKNLRVCEVGVAIRQREKSAIPIGRNFHRVLAVVACALCEPD